MNNSEIAKMLGRTADLLEIDGSDGFRVNSYRRASRTIKDSTEDVSALCAENRLTDLPGIGKGTASRIQSLIETGTMDVLDDLATRLPPGLSALLDVPGMGPKKIALAFHELGVGSLDDLKRVIDDGQLAGLKGMGATSVKRIAEGIAFLDSRGDRTPLGVALPIAEAMADRVRALPGAKRVEIAGSVRRGAETIGDVDILCEGEDGTDIINAFTAFEGVTRILAQGSTKGSVTVTLERNQELQVDLRVVGGDSFGAAWQYFTGSKEHNVRLREAAVKKKWRLNEYGLYEGEERIAGADEQGIYAKLGLAWVPPALREDRGEFEEGFDFSRLVAVDDIRGDLHMHTVASDGKNTITEMAQAAKKRGYKYIAICDHSKSSVIANGLTIDRMKEHIREIRKVNAASPGIDVLAGCECDILSDGSLDYPDDILAECDWVVASIHSAMGKGGSGKASGTARTLAAMENRYVSAIGHPTGRLIHRRAPMELDMAAVVAAAVSTNTFLEINASWQRLDLRDMHARQALEAGVKLVINTDAHSTDGLSAMRYGVMTARRGGATRDDVVNCATLAAFRKQIAAKRG